MSAQLPYDLNGKRVFVAGHRGMVGSAIVRRLATENCTVLTAVREELDLCSQQQVQQWFATHKPQVVFLAAAKVGGILANNTYPADFITQNLQLETNIIDAAHQNGVEKLIFLGSSCIYPKFAEQPIIEDALLTGPLEPTNEWYAIAKIVGIKLCQAHRRQFGCDFISGMPTNLYGPGDNYDLNASHVMPALLRKAYEAKLNNAKEIVVWGTGTPRREFLHVDDCADACVHLVKHYSAEQHVNIGSGEDISILDLTKLVCEIVGYNGQIVHDLSKPDGTPRKLMDSSKIRSTNWAPKIGLKEGIEDAYAWFLKHLDSQQMRK